jgi:hypothetical protein
VADEQVVDGEEVVGTQNDERLARLNEIANGNDETRVEQDGMDVPEDDSPEPVDIQEETVPEDEPKKYTIKVNGKTMELTEEELIARAQKVESADRYLQEAAEARRSVQSQPEPEPEPQVDDEDLARRLQMGTTEEAAEVIRQLRQASVGVKPEDLGRFVQTRMEMQEAATWFKNEYADVISDPRLQQIAIQEDQRLVSSGDTRAFRERYKEIGDNLRDWVKTIKAPTSLTDKQVRKASAPQVPKQASMRQETEVVEEDDDDYSSTIGKMAKSRGQGYI